MTMLDAFARFRALTSEQQLLVDGRGADTRSVRDWLALLEGLASFEAVRARAARQARLLSLSLAVVTGVLLGVALSPPFVLDEARAWLWGGAATAVPWAIALDVFLVLRRRTIDAALLSTTLPFVRALGDELGGEATLYLSLRTDRGRPAREAPSEWLHGAVSLDEHTLLHFTGRDVREPEGTRAWLRATISRYGDVVETHRAGEDNPSLSGLTRAVADDASRGGNPFTSMEMLALREAHGVQLELLKLEAFEAQRVPPPAVGDVVGEASRGFAGGRRSDDVNAAALRALWREAAGALKARHEVSQR